MDLRSDTLDEPTREVKRDRYARITPAETPSGTRPVRLRPPRAPEIEGAGGRGGGRRGEVELGIPRFGRAAAAPGDGEGASSGEHTRGDGHPAHPYRGSNTNARFCTASLPSGF